MKKFSIEKFRISKLNNMSAVRGGDNDTQTEDKKKKKCTFGSSITVEVPNDEEVGGN